MWYVLKRLGKANIFIQNPYSSLPQLWYVMEKICFISINMCYINVFLLLFDLQSSVDVKFFKFFLYVTNG